MPEMRKTSNWYGIVLNILLPAGLTILLFVGIIFGIIMPKFEDALLQEKRGLIKDLVGSVYNLVEHYHQRVLSGELTADESKTRVLERIRAMRYGPENKDYFWIHDLEPKMIMHPYRPDLEGKSIADLKDSQGTYLFIEMNKLVEASPTHDGYVDYLWQWKDEADTEAPKCSYVRLFAPWNWVIGTGVYLDDVHKEVTSVEKGFRRKLYAAFMVIVIFCGYLIIHGIRGELQRQADQKRLHESFDRFRTVMDSLPSHVVVSDIQTHEVLFMNASARNAFGEGVGSPCWQVLQGNQDGPCDPCSTRELFDKSGRPRERCQREYKNPVTQLWYECRDQLIRWVDGRQVRLEIATDITARKNAEQEREQLLKSLAVKNEELESIVYIASHDLRSPLINIQGFAGELELSFQQLSEFFKANNLPTQASSLSSLLEKDIPESLQYIKAGTEKMQMLVNGLLQLSRLGIATVEMQGLDMPALIENILQACRYQINSQGADIRYDDLPNCIGDYKLVNQVFTNLIDNALKYADPQRKLYIRISGRIVDEGVEYAVSDNGVGIEEEHLEKIFDIFCRFNTKASLDGLGLGLTIVKRILDILGGQIRVESESGKGTVFYITLPASK